jgi:N-acetylglucosamine kinase-like BadF-type ATPase
VLETLVIDGIDSLVHRVYRELARDEVAALAPLVQSAADRGDPAAQSIIDEAIREFVRGVESVIGRLGMAGERFRLVLSGGLWKAVPVLKQDLAGIVPKIAPWAEVHELTVEPARGAVAMALEVAHAKGLAPTPPSVQRL